MSDWNNCFGEVNLGCSTEDVLEKIERVITMIRDNYVPPDKLTVLCKPVIYQMLREFMWKSASIKQRGKWRAHKQQGITNLSRRQWIKENF